MILQERDQSIMFALARFGILSSQQIGELFFKSIRHTTLMKRLRILEKENLIVRSRGLPDSMSAWYLGQKGAKTLGLEAPPRYTNQNVIFHEVTLSQVRIALERIGLGENFTTERELRSQYEWKRGDEVNAKRVIPDGLFIANSKGSPVVIALEVELQPKNWARLQKVFSEYANMSSITYVLYIAKNEEIANLLIREWRKVKRYQNSPRLLVCFLDELKKLGDQTRIFNSEYTHLKLLEYFDCKTLLSPDRTTGECATQGIVNEEEQSLSKQAS